MLDHAWQKGRVPLSRAAIERTIEINGVAVEINLEHVRPGPTRGGRLLAREGDARAGGSRGPWLLQAPCVQGRVRGRPPVLRTGVPAAGRGDIRLISYSISFTLRLVGMRQMTSHG